MLLEYLVVGSAVIFCAALIGMLKGLWKLSIIATALSVVMALVGFSMFWRNTDGLVAILIVLALLPAQILVTYNILVPKRG